MFSKTISRRHFALIFYGLCVAAPASWGLTIQGGAHVGVMQQPTSNYFLGIYGATGDVMRDDHSLFFRLAYFERPEFRNNGFADKDFGGFAMAGSQILRRGEGEVLAMLGAGQMLGYTRVLGHDPDPTDEAHKRHYRLTGLTTALEYAYHWLGVDFAVSHQAFIGYDGTTQLAALVAWPYTFFLGKMGVRW